MKTIVSIQILRAAAAISVALCHYNQLWVMLHGRPNATFPLYPLAAGVDLFFVISGFVMVYSSEKLFAKPHAAQIFIQLRLARIVPLYWLTTLIAIPAFGAPVSWSDFLASVFFIPIQNDAGAIAPINGVGWTLNFEMFFYAIFAAAIRWRRDVAVGLITVVLCSVVLAGALLQPKMPTLMFWSDPIILEFTFGMILAILYRRNVILPVWLGVFLTTIGFIAIWFYQAPSIPSHYRVIGWGIPSACIFAGGVLGRLWENNGSLLTRLFKRLGDSSYGIYLIHSLVGAAILLSWPRLSFLPMIIVLAAGIFVTIAISTLVYVSFERPMQAILSGRNKKRPVSHLIIGN